MVKLLDGVGYLSLYVCGRRDKSDFRALRVDAPRKPLRPLDLRAEHDRKPLLLGSYFGDLLLGNRAREYSPTAERRGVHAEPRPGQTPPCGDHLSECLGVVSRSHRRRRLLGP